MDLFGSITALVTPFTHDGNIDFSSLKKLLHHQLAHGTDAVVFNGTTGEAPTISISEFQKIGEFIVRHLNKKIPAIAGIGGNDLRPVLDKLYLAESIGVDAVLVVSPAYSKPTPSGIYKYYAKIAESTHLPIILYNVPGRTASSIPLETINKLQNEYPHIIGIKEASGDLERTMSIIHSTPSWFKVYCGDDFLALASMLVGADGCISVVSNQIPGPFKNLVHLALNGNVREARRIHYNYFNLMTMNFIETNPIPVKTSLHLMGLCEPYFRLPLDNMTSENKKELKKLLTRLDLILPAENHLMKLPAG